ncbi:hypothetical protein BDV32DRAFT_108754 [Aspergillus pseudonomiae]|uniref:Uncharacterized protein n=1 Tax=Aspergillus pseudonomiae TaxID=1506151 RepID=A0A5N6HNB5_9EURO|nr:uncharacterized protein BDV37DRAFT_283126 [Aspergillus pseudonomiae]KAB8255748.1 hypothetical protein BDV32DRAFT_108754 [Aspergillus pseudonomiae]KAE8404079.1 hypothetical protein BDV37DRAFT_283126 [Aspergillus pseudonomiae]
MARLCVPGFIFRRDRPTARYTTQPAFRSFPRTVAYRANPPVSPRSFLPVSSKAGVHSFSAVSTSSTGDRSFSQMSQGSHLPVRSVRAPATPSTTAPASTGVVDALKALSSRLAERRAARQARLRPWAQPSSTSRNSSSGHPSMPAHRKPAPTKSAIRQPTKPVNPAGGMVTRAQRTIARIDDTLAKLVSTSGRKDKPRKRVRFGETTVIPVERWIVRSEHSFIFPSWFGNLQGWRVVALSEPNDDGETEKYVSMWGSDHYDMLYTHAHSETPCSRQGCVWDRMKHIMSQHPKWTPAMVIKGFNVYREKMRQRGKFYL